MERRDNHDWEQRKFEKFAQRQSNTMISNPDNPCIEYEDVISEQGILNKDVCSKDAEKNGIIFTEEDILYGKLRPYLHNWLNPDFKGVAVGDWWVLRPINMDKNFLYWLIQTPQYDNAANQSSGTKMPRADWKLVSNTDFYVPISNEEQAKIAGLFEKINTLITLHQRKCEQTKELKKFMLQKMFPKKGEKNPEIRFPGFTDDWEQRKLGEVAKFINGRAYSQDELLNDGKYKVLRVGNFYTNDSWYYSDMELDDKYYAENGDLLYTWSATFGPHIWHGDKVVYHYHIWKINLSKSLEKTFALQLLERDKEEILADKNGSTMVHITKSGMENKKVLLPENIEEQQKIGEYFSNLDNLITLHQRKCEQLKELKKFMLQNMFPKKG